MDRRRYELVALWIVLVAVTVASLVRYQASRPHWHHVLTLPLTGAVHTAHLQTTPETRLNLNLATSEELDTLPGISRKTAQVIIATRLRKPFEQLVELLQFDGIGERRLAEISAVAYCGPATNVSTGDMNE